MVILGFIISSSLFLVGIIIADGQLSMFFDLPSFALALLPAIILVPMTGKREAFTNGLKVAWKPSKSLSGDKRREAMACFDMMFRVTLVSGLLGTMTGLMIMFSTMETGSQEFFKTLPIPLLTTYYGLIFSLFLYYPIRVAIDKGKD